MYAIGKPLSVLVYARPDRMSDALLSLLSGMQMIKEIDRVQEIDQAITTIAYKKTDLVLLDMSSTEEGLQFLIPAIKQANGNVYCLSVVDTVRLGRISQQSGANHVLLRGFSGNELLEVIMKAQTHHLTCEDNIVDQKATYLIK